MKKFGFLVLLGAFALPAGADEHWEGSQVSGNPECVTTDPSGNCLRWATGLYDIRIEIRYCEQGSDGSLLDENISCDEKPYQAYHVAKRTHAEAVVVSNFIGQLTAVVTEAVAEITYLPPGDPNANVFARKILNVAP